MVFSHSVELQNGEWNRRRLKTTPLKRADFCKTLVENEASCCKTTLAQMGLTKAMHNNIQVKIAYDSTL